MIGGKVMMDRNAPEALTDTAQAGYDETRALIGRGRWRGRWRGSRPGPRVSPAPGAAASSGIP